MKKIFLFLFIFLAGFIFTKEVSAQTAPSLSVVLGTGFVTTPTPGSSIELSKFIFIADGTDDIKINSLTITRSGASNDHDIINLKLIDSSSGTQFGATSGFAFGKATFANVNYIIPKGSSRTLAVRADVDYTFTSTSSVYIGINSASDISAVGTASALVSSIPGTFPLNVYSAPTTPDLTVLDIYDDNGKLSVKIGNIGSGTAPSGVGHLYIWIDDQLKWTYSLSTLYDQSFLAPGGMMVGQPQVLSGQHKIKAVIDPNGTIAESNENNNTLEKTLTFGTSTATATTTVASIKVISPNSGEQLQKGQEIQIKFEYNGIDAFKPELYASSYCALHRSFSPIAVTSSPMSYSVMLPTDCALGYYKLRLYGYKNNQIIIQDDSDASVEVVSSAAPNLALKLNSAVSTQVIKGSKNQVLFKADLWANDYEDIKISSLYLDELKHDINPIYNNYQILHAGLSNLKLNEVNSDGTLVLLSNTYSRPDNMYDLFTNFSLIIPQGGKKTIAVTADIPSETTSTYYYMRAITSYNMNSINATGVTSGKPSTFDQIYITGPNIYLASVSTSTQSIKVTSPNGGESLEIGKTYDIAWTSNGTEKVHIDITSPGGAYTLTSGILASSGKYSWTVNKSWPYLSAGTQYKIRVFTYPLPASGAWQEGVNYDQSDNYFSVVGSTALSSIKVTSPNGGEIWQIGQTYPIRWTTAGYSADALIQISLWDTRYSYDTVIAKTANSGSYNFTVPSSLGSTSGGSLGGSNIYKIRAQVYSTSFQEGVTTDSSDAPFGIATTSNTSTSTASSIKVISPNGGEKWERGKTYKISWNSTGHDKVRISLQCENYGSDTFMNVPSGSAGGSYSYTAPTHWPDQNQCRVQVAENLSFITNIQNGINSDDSDAPFSVVAAGSVAEVLKADLKVNNFDQPVVPINYGSRFAASWISSGASYCTGYGTDVIAEDGGVWTTGKYLASGSKILYAKSISGSVPFSTFHLGIQCWDDSGKSVMDLVGNIPVAIQTTGQVPIKDGSVVRIQGVPDVYFIKDGQKVKINSPKEFEEKGYKWDQIQTVQADLLAQIAELKAQVKQLKEDLAKAGALLKSMTGPDVYVIVDGKKEKIPDPETFNKRGYKWDQIKSVSQEDLSSIPDFTSTTTQQATTAPTLPQGITPGSLVKSPNSPTVYFITPTGAKKPILNIKVFNAYNNKWDNVKTVSQDEINSSPTVNAIRIGNDPKVYFISNGQKQWIKTPEAFAKQGLKWDQIVSVNKTEFEEYKEGEEIE